MFEAISVGSVTLVLCVICLGLSLYQGINIFLGKAVRAEVAGYDEDSHYDTNTNTHVDSMMPVYRYYLDGQVHTYRSHFSLLFTWLKKDSATLYVSKSGKVFEVKGVITTLVMAVIFFLIV